VSGTKRERPWYLQSMKTEIGIEASGEIGFLGTEGEAAIELIWMRTPQSIRKLQEEAGMIGNSPAPAPAIATLQNDIAEDTASFSSEMKPKQVSERIEAIVQYVGKTRNISNLDRLRNELLRRSQELHGWVGQLEQLPENLGWQPYKYQVQLYIKGEGMVVPTIEVGVVSRIRLEWSLVSRKNRMARDAASQSSFLENLISDLQVLDSVESDSSMYSFTNIKAGLGVGAGGDIVIGEIEGSVLGSIFLKRVKPAGKQPILAIDLPGKTPMQRGLVKAAEISRYVLSQAEKHERAQDKNSPDRAFELGAIEVELEFSVEGGSFLPTVSKNAAMELFFTKKGRSGGGF
jgi:hypothetical protein